MIRKGSRVVAASTVYDTRAGLRRPIPKGTVGKLQLVFDKVDEAYVGVYVRVEKVGRVAFPGGLVAEVNVRALSRAPERSRA